MGGPTDNGQAERDDLLRKAKDGRKFFHPVLHGVYPGPDRTKPDIVGREKQVLHGGRVILGQYPLYFCFDRSPHTNIPNGALAIMGT